MSARTAHRRRGDHLSLGRTLVAASLTALLAGGAALSVWYGTPRGRQPALAWGGVVLVLVLVLTGCVAAAVYGLSAAHHHRRCRVAADAEATRLAERTLPELVGRLRAGASVEAALADLPVPAHPSYETVLVTFAREVGRGERVRTAAMSICGNAAARVQALTTRMLADLREMEHRHGEEVLGDLLHLDHRTAQAGRLADSIAVLTGSRTGRRWPRPIAMESILRGAMGRIDAYQRVQLHSSSTLAVAAHAAEGVMHALAELMDNATSFSPPSEEVHVYVEEVSNGVVVTIEDGGLAMSDDALARARRAVSAEPLDLTTLSGTRLGLVVVGCLARKHGLQVSFRPSSRGGTGAVVMIPQPIVVPPGQSAHSDDGPGRRRGQAAPAPPPQPHPDHRALPGHLAPEQRSVPPVQAEGTFEWTIPTVDRWPGPEEDSWGRPLLPDGRQIPPPAPPAPGQTWDTGTGPGTGPRPVPFSAYGDTSTGTPGSALPPGPAAEPPPNPYRAEGPEHAYGAPDQGMGNGLPSRRGRAPQPPDPGTPASATRGVDRRTPEENAARLDAFHRGVRRVRGADVRGTDALGPVGPPAAPGDAGASETSRNQNRNRSQGQSQEGET